MRIGMDIRSTLKPARTGIGQYTFNLVNSLSGIDHHNQYLLYSRIKPFSNKRNPRITAKNFRFFTERFSHKPDKFFERVDLFHTSSYDLIPPRNKKLILTLHDVIVKAYPAGHPEETAQQEARNISRILENAKGLIVISENTKKDVVKWFKFPEQRIKVIHLGASEEFRPLNSEEKTAGFKAVKSYGIEGEFILFAGTIEPRKNLENLTVAFKRLKDERKITHKLVIAGMKSARPGKIFELVDKLGLSKDVIFTGYVRQEDINFFYNLADCFIYPSFYEGFGLPIVEAFHAGSAVITSNRSSCAEVAGNAAVLIDPDSVEQMADAMLRVVSDRALNAELRKKAISRARDFSWDIAARKTLNFFQEIYKKSG